MVSFIAKINAPMLSKHKQELFTVVFCFITMKEKHMMWGLISALEHGKTLCFGPAKYGNAAQHLTVCLGDSQCILTYK